MIRVILLGVLLSGCVTEPTDVGEEVATVGSFDLEWDQATVSLSWRMGDPVQQENLRLRVAPLAGGSAVDLVVGAQDSEGLGWSAVDDRPELAAGGIWLYELSAREPGGGWMLLRSEELSIDAAPGPALALMANPNPFNPSTRLSFDLPEAGPVHLAVYDLTGRRLALIHEGTLPAGPASFDWEGRDDEDRPLASGVYFARIVHEGGSQKTKLVMIR